MVASLITLRRSIVKTVAEITTLLVLYMMIYTVLVFQIKSIQTGKTSVKV